MDATTITIPFSLVEAVQNTGLNVDIDDSDTPVMIVHGDGTEVARVITQLVTLAPAHRVRRRHLLPLLAWAEHVDLSEDQFTVFPAVYVAV